jgi:hypothetical protein
MKSRRLAECYKGKDTKIFSSENVKGRGHLRDLGLENNIKMNLKVTGYEDVDWIHLAWDRDQ